MAVLSNNIFTPDRVKTDPFPEQFLLLCRKCKTNRVNVPTGGLLRESPSYGQTLHAQKTILRKRIMFGFKSKREKLEAKLAKTLKEAFELSHTDRKKSDEKNAEADEITKQLDALD